MDNVDHVGISTSVAGISCTILPIHQRVVFSVSNLDDVVDRWNLVYKDSWRNISDNIVRRVVG